MKIICLTLISLLAAAGPAGTPFGPEEEGRPEETVPVTVTVEVEGVTARSQSAPIAALREIAGRLEGELFSVIDGKYVMMSEKIFSPSLDTEAKKIVAVDQLETGLFKARVEVQTTPETSAVFDKLRERIVWGEGKLLPGSAPILARDLAREDAIKKAVLEAVGEAYPHDTEPAHLEGRVFFLGTVRESIEDGLYRMMARIKVLLAPF